MVLNLNFLGKNLIFPFSRKHRFKPRDFSVWKNKQSFLFVFPFLTCYSQILYLLGENWESEMFLFFAQHFSIELLAAGMQGFFSLQSPWVRNEQLRSVLGESRLSLLRQNSALLPARQGSCKVQPSARSRRAQDLGAKQNGADAAAAFFCATGCAVTADTPWP